jgi:3-oxoacyl-[acyl-carrier protein] reductase
VPEEESLRLSPAEARAWRALAPFRVDGTVACVTGAASGMGRAIAELLSAVGAAVVVGDVDDVAAKGTVDGIAAAGGHAISHGVDVRDRAQVEAFVQRAVDTYGRLDFMCNIAGIPAAEQYELQDLPDAEYQRVMAVNVQGVLYGCQAAAPHIAATGGGAILNASSTSIDTAGTKAGFGLYELSKMGVVSLTRTFAYELAAKKIRVNAIAPGVTASNFVSRHYMAPDGTLDEAKHAEWTERMSAVSPLGRVGLPEDQAWLALYLLSEAGRFVTGQVVRANGGWTMR